MSTVSMRTLRRRLLTSIVIFVGSVLLLTSVLTRLVDNDMYRGAMETGEDYYISPKGPSELAYYLAAWPSNTLKLVASNTSSVSNESSVVDQQEQLDGSPMSDLSKDETDIRAVNIAIIVKDVGQSPNSTNKLLKDFQACAESIVRHAKELPLHFVLLTDPRSVEALSVVVRNLARVRARVHITVDYVDLDAATRNVSQVISRLKELFSPEEDSGSKYRLDLFHVAPLYHRLLPPSTSRLLVMDADLRFKADVAQLYREFTSFEPSQLMALAPEMSPLYYEPFAKHRLSNSSSTLGLASGFPGLNSGVVLFNLGRMRRNLEYNALLDEEGLLSGLCSKYGDYRGAKVGDQDLFTLLAAARPGWVRTLDCGWNIQLDETFKQHPLYEDFHKCTSEIKSLHGNGGVVIPTDL